MKVIFSLDVLLNCKVDSGAPQFICELCYLPRVGETVALPESFIKEACAYARNNPSSDYENMTIEEAYFKEEGMGRPLDMLFGNIENQNTVDYIYHDIEEGTIDITLK